MPCATLSLQTETFGAPYPRVTTASALPGRLGDVPAGATSMTVATVAVQLVRPVAGTVQITVAGRQRLVIGRPASSPPFQVALFRSRTHVLVVDDSGSTGARQVSLLLFSVAGTAEPITLGPYSVPDGVQLNLADGANGKLLLFWHDRTASSGTGKVARLARTDTVYAGSDALVSCNEGSGTNLVLCRVDGPSRSLELLAGAASNGPDSFTLPSPAQIQALPGTRTLTPARLSVSPNSLTIGDLVVQRTLQVQNTGSDLLEIRSVSATGLLVALTPSITLPTCLPPGGTLDVTVRRTGSQGGTATVTVTSDPAPNLAAEGRVTVSVARQTPDPALALSAPSLQWSIGIGDGKPLTLTNRGNVPLTVTVSAPGQGFSWLSTGRSANTPFEIAPGDSAWLDIRPPSQAATSSISITAVDADGQAIAGSPFTVTLASGIPGNVNPGDLLIGSWVVDPPGPDILPEGEHIELNNVSGRDLIMTGVTLSDQKFSTSGSPNVRVLWPTAKNPLSLNGGSVLPAGGSLRILTRAKAPVDPANDFGPMPWRIYLGRDTAVWNNTGDMASLVYAPAVLLDSKLFRREPQTGTGGPVIPPGTVVAPPRRVPGLSRRIYVRGNADYSASLMLEDGDLVTVRAASGTIAMGGFGGSCGPAGKPGSTAVDTLVWIPLRGDFPYPVPGVPEGVLIARVRQGTGTGNPFVVGAGGSFRVRSILDMTGPITMEFGINDCFTEDNSGSFEAEVDVYRS